MPRFEFQVSIRTAFLCFQLVLLICTAPQTLNAQEKAEKLDLVYIGQSWLQSGLPSIANAISEDLGVPVKIWQRNSTLVPFATKMLNSPQGNVIDDAEIVLVQMSGTFGRRSGYCLDTNADYAFSQSPEELRAETDKFFAELAQHVDPKEVMVRVAVWGVPPYYRSIWEERGFVDECAAGWSEIMEQWRQPAEEHGIKVIDLMELWNGPGAQEKAPSHYFGRKDIYLTEDGIASIVELIREIGYEPLER